jgi:hypothetical protein
MKTSPGSIYEKARKAGSTEGAARLWQLASDLGRNTDLWPLPVKIKNLHSGWRQKSKGAWSWVLIDAKG